MKKLKKLVALSVLLLSIILGFWYFEPFSGLSTIDGLEAYIELPENHNTEEKLPVLMAIHGNGRSAASYSENSRESVGFYVHQKDLATSEGYLFVSISNETDTWGTDKGLKNLDNLYTYVQDNYNVEDEWALWATSAGAVQMNRFIKNFPNRIDRAIGTFPVYDLSDMINHNNTAKLVWEGKDITNINPANYPKDLSGIPYLIYHGKDDEIVPPEKHSIRFTNDINNLGGNVTLRLVDGGHSTANFNVYDDDEIKRFLNE